MQPNRIQPSAAGDHQSAAAEAPMLDSMTGGERPDAVRHAECATAAAGTLYGQESRRVWTRAITSATRERRIVRMSNRVNKPALILLMLVAWPALAGQRISLKDAARAAGGKASTSSDVDLPSASLPQLVAEADLIVEARIVSKRGVLCADGAMVCTEYQIVPTRTFKDRVVPLTRRTPGPGAGIVVRQAGGRLVEDGLELESRDNLFPVEGLTVGRGFVMLLRLLPGDSTFGFVRGPFGVFALEGSSVLPSTEHAAQSRQPIPREVPQLYAEIARLGQRSEPLR